MDFRKGCVMNSFYFKEKCTRHLSQISSLESLNSELGHLNLIDPHNTVCRRFLIFNQVFLCQGGGLNIVEGRWKINIVNMYLVNT